jgi:hypothetical protein
VTGAPSQKPVLTGGCQCGAVRYALYATPEGTRLCQDWTPPRGLAARGRKSAT